MSMLRSIAVAGSVVALVAVAATSPVASAVLDTPSLAVTDNSAWRIGIRVTAGVSGAPNGFTIDWMTKAAFDQYGWPTDYIPPGFNYCSFNGIPTFNLTSGVLDYLLGSSEGVRVVLGELFDETGLYTTYTDDMIPGTEYAVRVRADGGPLGDESANSGTYFVTSDTHEDCRFTVGYWKNHPEAWPTNSLTLGNNVYNMAELLAILNEPANGNGLLILAHQLIAAKLNALLAAPPASIQTAIQNADNMIGNLVVPPTNGSTDSLPSAQVSALATQLDDFNNGQTAGDTCATPATPTSWGRLKSLYR